MGLTRSERETLIRWDEAEQVVSVFSASPKVWRRLARLGLEPHKETTRGGKPSGRFYRLPLARFRWGLRQKARNPGGRGTAALQAYREARRQGLKAQSQEADGPHGGGNLREGLTTSA